MIKALTKFGFSAGAITGTICASENALAEPDLQEPRLKKSSKKLGGISTFEEIDIYAKENGCSFAFIAEWGNKKVYNVREFIRLEKEKEKETSTEWEKKAREIADSKKGLCKGGKTILFAYHQGKFSLKPAP